MNRQRLQSADGREKLQSYLTPGAAGYRIVPRNPDLLLRLDAEWSHGDRQLRGGPLRSLRDAHLQLSLNLTRDFVLKLDRVRDGHLLCRHQRQDTQLLPSQLQLRPQLSLIPGRRPRLERVPGGPQLLQLTEGAVVNLRAKLLNLRERQHQKLERRHRQRS